MKMFFSEKKGSIMVDMRKVDRSTKTVKQRKEASEIIRKYLDRLKCQEFIIQISAGSGFYPYGKRATAA